jgi:NADPH-dependent 2,4-dienoyl-CoA reductase/sulfur reductase-like enzyme
MRHVVVVGGSIAGLTAVEKLRRAGHSGQISVLDADRRPPYDRPPLSKQVLTGAWDADQAQLRAPEALRGLGADLRLGEAARWLDVDNRQVFTSAGRTLDWDGLIIASGARPRRLPFGHEFPNVHVLRSLDDALSLRNAFAATRSIVVVGAGFLGSEVAASARTAGLDVTLVDSLAAPMAAHLGVWVGGLVARAHARRGVRLVMETSVRAIEGRRRAERVVLGDGTEIEADLVVVAIGCEPNVDWLLGSGLTVDDGVLCDANLRAAMDVVAAGDVARWFNPRYCRTMRVEHRVNAAEQAAVAASNLLGADLTYSALPYFWSEQYDIRVQAVGDFSGATHVEVIAGDVAQGRFAALYHRAGVGAVAGITWNLPARAAEIRRYLTDACAVQARTPI